MISIISYGIVIFITIFFTYIFDVRENYMVLYMLIIAPLLDYLIFLYQKKSVNVMLENKDDNLEKKQYTYVNLYITNESIIPIANISYELLVNGKFYTNDSLKEKISIGGKDTLEKKIELQAIHRGAGEIEVAQVNIKSPLGLFKNEIQLEDYTSKRIVITPALIELDGVERMLDETTNYEDSDETSNYSYSGEPGYDFREYVEGDPLSKVNWKLSAKRDVLMIRKSSTSVRHKKVIVLDPVIPAGAYYEENGDLFIETLIGMAKELFTLEYDVEIIYKEEKSWKNICFNNIDVMATLQNIFSYYDFSYYDSKGMGRFNNFNVINEESCDYIIISGNEDGDLIRLASSLEEAFNSVTLISNYKNKIIESQYYLRHDYTVERL